MVKQWKSFSWTLCGKAMEELFNSGSVALYSTFVFGQRKWLIVFIIWLIVFIIVVVGKERSRQEKKGVQN